MTKEELPWQPDAATPMSVSACLNFGGGMDIYAVGFRAGADALIERLEATGNGQDVLVYPLVYCLRHAVEINLKLVVWAARRLLEDSVTGFPDNHDIAALWHTAKPLLGRVWPKEPDTMRRVEGVVMSLARLDPSGESFRYALSRRKNGSRDLTLDPDLRNLDLGALHKDVSEVLDLLDGAQSGLEQYIENATEAESEWRALRAEMEAEMRAEYQEPYDRGDPGGW
jgi:hypothetical protein